jgi:hypothetical protein
MSKQKKTYWILAWLTSLFFIIPLLPVTAQEQAFTVEPSQFDINLATTEPVEVDFIIASSYDEVLNFRLGLESVQRESLATLPLQLTAVIDDQEIDLLSETTELNFADKATREITIRVEVSESVDIQEKIDIKLQQIESDRRLNQQEYILTLNLDAQIESQANRLIIDAIGITLVAAGLVLAAIFYINRNH